MKLLDGWTIERADHKPFKCINLRSPDGWVATFSNLDQNPGIVAYRYFDDLLKQEEQNDSR